MMQKLVYRLRHLMPLTAMLLSLGVDAVRFLRLCLRLRPTLAAENLFLRKQLALYQERQVKPRCATDATRLVLVWLGRWFDWRTALALVTPQTFTRWHRQGFRLFWRGKSRRGRPRIPAELQALIRRMARENPTWGQERIAALITAPATFGHFSITRHCHLLIYHGTAMSHEGLRQVF